MRVHLEVSIETGEVLRACHHWAGVPWTLEALSASYTVPTSLSVVWGIAALSLMLLGNRRQRRETWISGAQLMTLVVIKLFAVELAAVASQDADCVECFRIDGENGALELANTQHAPCAAELASRDEGRRVGSVGAKDDSSAPTCPAFDQAFVGRGPSSPAQP